MSYHERHLPHCYPSGATLFLTWRLFGSLANYVTTASQTAGQAFAQADRILDQATEGPTWLNEPRIAAVVADALKQGEKERKLYELGAWVVMPNHVHAVIKPFRPLPDVVRWIKGSTARAANLILGRTGAAFWQRESYDHLVRSSEEMDRISRYIERNPVRAGLARDPEDWPWSSAFAGQRPTLQKP